MYTPASDQEIKIHDGDSSIHESTLLVLRKRLTRTN